MIGLIDLFVSGLLICNGAAILSENRFLAKIGWGYEESLSQPMSVKKQIINLLHAVRLIFTLPLMVLNVVVIFLKLTIA
jgi:immediate early response 3-interacting protein 1